jgi:hypothetical protein
MSAASQQSLIRIGLVERSSAATILTVTSSADSGAGTLRQAILDAGAGDTINFAGGITPITLTSAELLINKSLTISGPGANLLTVQRSTTGGTPDFRIFHIASGAFIVTISGLTISNGNTTANGGGISNESTSAVNVTDSTVSGNTAGGGSAGGGIVNGVTSTLTLTNSTVSGNTAVLGGGIFDNHTVTLTNSTVSGNNTSSSGGGIFCNGCTLTLTNSTVSGNIGGAGNNGGGGIFTGQGAVTLTNSTVSGNTSSGSGGGINSGSGTVNVKNTIIAGNTAVGSAPDLAGSFTSQGYNLIGNSDGSQGFANDVNNDQVGSDATPLDPELGPLQNNGGPTFTHALLTGSPAIDKGAAATDPTTGSPITADQRGFTRPLDDPSIPNASGGDGSDIGSFEEQTLAPTPTLTLTPTPTPTRTATPTPTVTASPGGEICGNCIDDDDNGMTDSGDPACAIPNGGGVGLGDAKRGKAVVKCAIAIQKSGAKFGAKHLARLQQCLDTVLACVQVQDADPACLTKAQSACEKGFAAFTRDEASLTATITKSCGPPAVAPSDLTDATGLGYGAQGQASPCVFAGGAVPTDAAGVATCVAKIHACRAAAALGIEVPRAASLLTLVNHQAAEFPCLPAVEVGGAANLGDAKTGKVAAKCETAIKKAGAKLVGAEVKGLQKCANGVLTCVQVKPTDTKCLPKARTACDKVYNKLVDTGPGKGLGNKLLAAVLKGCQVPALSLSDVFDDDGLGLESIESACTAIHANGIQNGITATSVCLTGYHKCNASLFVEGEIPRLRELLLLGGHAALP